MNILQIENDFSYFLTENYKIRHELWDRLRFREKNYFHNRAYKMKKWDGYINFFAIETGKFLTGLLPEVTAFLRHNKIEYKVDDKRQHTKFFCENIDKDFLKESNLELRDYQVELINQVIKHKRGIIFAPTSAGKSLIMIGIIKTLNPNTPTLVLQNRLSLAHQNYEELVKLKFPNVGHVWGGSVKPNIITVASVQSVSKIQKILPKIKVLIVDEIHDMMSRLPKAVYRRLKNTDVRVAVSATPFKDGGKDNVQKFSVRGYFGPILKVKSASEGVLTTSELQGRGILSKSKCIFYPIREPQIPHDIYIDAVTRGIAENLHFHKIVTKLAKAQKGRTLILVDRIAHGDVLHGLIPGSLWIQGKDDIETRKNVIKELQKSEKDIIAIATQQIFNTGVNIYCHNLINAAGGQADHQIVQRIGRGLRTANDKEILNYHDFIFEINDYLEKHSRKRMKILEKQGHEIETKEISSK